MIKELKKAIKIFNKNDDKRMTFRQIGVEYYKLYIGGYLITEGDDIDLLDRVKGINKENGYEDI